MNKKILSLLLALLVAIQCFAFTGFASEEISAFGIAHKDFLTTIGIIAEDVDGTETVTRGKAAFYIARMLGTSYTNSAYKGVFADVPENNEYAIAIETLADLGIVRGDGNYKYRPDDNLTYYEASCIFAYILGYGIAGDVSTRAYEYVNRNDIFNGVEARYDYVNFTDLFMMIYNALHSGVLEQVTYGSNPEFRMSDDDILSKNFGILYAYGTVVKNDLTYLWTTQDADQDTLELDMEDDGILTVDLSKSRPDTTDILGKYVTLYYYPNSNTKKIEYVYHDVEDSEKIHELPFTQLNLNKSDISSGEIYYYNEREDLKKLTLSEDCALIYNNAVYKSHTIDLSKLKGKVGKVEVIDYDSNNKYDVVKLKVYDTMVVGSVSQSYSQIYDQFDVKKTVGFDERDYTKIFVYDASGNAISVNDIVEGDIISVAKSDAYSGDNVLEIVVSKTFFNGKITEYDSVAYEPKMVIDNMNEYVVADRAAEITDYKIGNSIIGYVDAFGNLVYISEDYGRDLQYGIVIGTDWNPKGLKNEAKVKLRTLSGDVEILGLAENVILDGKTYKAEHETVISKLEAVNTVIDDITLEDIFVIRYKKDSDGNLKIIDTTKADKGGDKDTLELAIAGDRVVDGQDVIGRTVAVKSGSPVLCVAVSDFTDASLYEDTTAVYPTTMTEAFRLNVLYKCVAYRSDPESSYADLVLKFDASTLYYDDGFFVVDVVKKAYNDRKEETMYKIEGMLQGARKSLWMEEAGTNKQLNASGSVMLTDELKDAVRGDVIRCVTDANDYIVGYEYIYSRGGENKVLTKPISSADFTPNKVTSLVMHNGYVYSREGALIKCNNLAYGNVKDVKDIDMDAETLYTTVIPSAVTVVVVDDTEEKIFAGSSDDILDYERFDNNCSMILTRFRSDLLKEIIIYNK